MLCWLQFLYSHSLSPVITSWLVKPYRLIGRYDPLPLLIYPGYYNDITCNSGVCVGSPPDALHLAVRYSHTLIYTVRVYPVLPLSADVEQYSVTHYHQLAEQNKTFRLDTFTSFVSSSDLEQSKKKKKLGPLSTSIILSASGD